MNQTEENGVLSSYPSFHNFRHHVISVENNMVKEKFRQTSI
jgi:hypothetical protein